MVPPALRLSRRDTLTLAAMLAAMMGLGLGVVTPETSACAELSESPSGVAFCDTAVGSGIPASKGLLIKAHYTGRLQNGTQIGWLFDSSYNRGVGVGEVIRG